ncbi:NAD(P)/FAD-dependent oxidoreductase [Agrobacterium tumefaciens]|uniref:NAD(P)/FAD-dependent oxidoreductase n=1 Tax=Agrobacterium tumefaciens TaxID=358 RepID=A0A4D7Z0Y0_AGRTU|nr:FAD/NAD(P)-binding oxidoreductase [Agrobacterium tumefaciens]QCL95940.1 NAD(P)/FAD-dependent oxidoreductase [Agrobacterium tumefaciens]
MADLRIVIVGAGPAGTRAAETLVRAGLRPVVIDEGDRSGGQIYRRQPQNFRRSYAALYGTEADKAKALHVTFDGLSGHIDYRPQTLAWAICDNRIHIQRGETSEALDFDALIIASGATDRIMPLPGWTRPGCFSLGAAQISLKVQACAIGRRVVFMGTGPLLYLVAYQYMKAGAAPVAVLDTTPFSTQIKGLPGMIARPTQLLKGMRLVGALLAGGVRIERGIVPLEIIGDAESGVTGIRYRDASGEEKRFACDAVGMGYHLRAESQLADLAGCRFSFHPSIRQWLPDVDDMGRSSVPSVYLAGDGVRILGADGAEASGRLAAFALLEDQGLKPSRAEIGRCRKQLRAARRFALGMARAFPWPHQLAQTLADDTIICRCEVVTAGELRASVTGKGATEVNRSKAFSRAGMGRCQGRFCGQAGQEIVAAASGLPVESAGRLRGQAPVKPLSLAIVRGDDDA